MSNVHWDKHLFSKIFSLILLIKLFLFKTGRVTMSMTTLLTLSSMFNALTTITPPISYVTKLDIWMVLCIAFVFSTLLEFTVVIFLKYYLRHLPTFQFSQSRAESRSKKTVFDVSNNVQAWLKVTFYF